MADVQTYLIKWTMIATARFSRARSPRKESVQHLRFPLIKVRCSEVVEEFTWNTSTLGSPLGCRLSRIVEESLLGLAN